MTAIKTVFVIGAGASAEAGLPTGYQLRQSIANLLNFPANLYEQDLSTKLVHQAIKIYAKRKNPSNLDSYFAAASHISSSMPLAQSIDNFIDTQRANEEIEVCGKLAIGAAILDAERLSESLHVDESNIFNTIDLSKTDKTWYNNFFRLITINCDKSQLKDRFSNITLIIFNYDRCIEHFLYHALKIYYELSEVEAVSLIKILKIFHPYGKVGDLNWQSATESIRFGERPSSEKLIKAAAQIKTFTEGTDSSESEILSIRKEVADAEKIVFLGFAYHPLNLRLIQPGAMLGNNSLLTQRQTKIFGTAKGISNSDCKLISLSIANVLNVNPDLIEIDNNLSCIEFFHSYSRSISLTDKI